MEKKLYRDEHHKVISGVCAGLADYFGIDVSIVRLVFVLTLILKGGGGLLYIILWIVLPKKPFSYIPPVDYTVPPTPGSPYQQYQSANPSYQPTSTFVPQPQKHPSTAALIGGLVLILLGGGFLLDEFNIIPDWDFSQWWPVILVVIGLTLMFRGSNKPKPAPQAWQQPAELVQPQAEVKEEPSNDNPSTEI
jgi:phage shock protein PspC (stress-responsive transcriptional regulator)